MRKNDLTHWRISTVLEMVKMVQQATEAAADQAHDRKDLQAEAELDFAAYALDGLQDQLCAFARRRP